jgi:hypothetical protein
MPAAEGSKLVSALTALEEPAEGLDPRPGRLHLDAATYTAALSPGPDR